MYILWKWSMILFVLQMLGGAVAYWITGTVSTAAVTALFFIPLVLVILTFITSITTQSLDSRVGFNLSVNALILGLLLFPLRGSVLSTVWVCVSVAAVLCITSASVTWKIRRETKDGTSFVSMFFVSLPFGIGAVFGLASFACAMFALLMPQYLRR